MILALAGALAAQTPPPAPPVAACAEPVYLVVWVDKLDRTKSRAYGEGLRSSGIVRRNGGKYQLVSPPLMMLEGEWPADRGFVVESYPCLDALKAMWFSDEYQKKLKPLRAGSGEYTVAVFKAFTTLIPLAAPQPSAAPGPQPSRAPR
jgi:uncharacterized protein (DUF1330 family)